MGWLIAAGIVIVLALLPWALVGLVLGMAVVRCIRNTNVLGLVIALLILGVQALSLRRNWETLRDLNWCVASVIRGVSPKLSKNPKISQKK